MITAETELPTEKMGVEKEPLHRGPRGTPMAGMRSNSDGLP